MVKILFQHTIQSLMKAHVFLVFVLGATPHTTHYSRIGVQLREVTRWGTSTLHLALPRGLITRNTLL